MEKLREQELKIEDTRNRLGELVLAKGFNMQDADLILLSDEMNRLIVDFHKARQLVSCIKWNFASTEVVISSEG